MSAANLRIFLLQHRRNFAQTAAWSASPLCATFMPCCMFIPPWYNRIPFNHYPDLYFYGGAAVGPRVRGLCSFLCIMSLVRYVRVVVKKLGR